MNGLLPIPAWTFMWAIALALYATGKGASLLAGDTTTVPLGRKFAYLLLFPGMNARDFCSAPPRGTPSQHPGIRYVANAVAGAALVWGVARHIPATYPLVRGWLGMLGLVMLLHFGLLQLAALAWRVAGRDAPALMQEPLRSASVSDFWGHRWNTAFRDLSHQFVFRPLVRRTGPRAAMWLTFAVSGILHDLVISVPARAGFGLPTVYFLLQAAALSVERSPGGRRLLRHPRAARAFAIAVVALPVPLLFHPPFVMRVMLPFLAAIGAIPTEVLP